MSTITSTEIFTSTEGVARVGCRIRLSFDGEVGSELFSLSEVVSPSSSDAEVSAESPVGRAVLGRVVGDVVSVVTPGGVSTVRIEEILL